MEYVPKYYLPIPLHLLWINSNNLFALIKAVILKSPIHFAIVAELHIEICSNVSS